MILGIGTDIVKIERIRKACIKETFLKKCFTSQELVLLGESQMRYSSAAGFFAAKEAVAKALGTGFRGFGLTDIEVVKNQWNKPSVVLHNAARQLAGEKGIKQILVSISHEMEFAVAYAVAEGE